MIGYHSDPEESSRRSDFALNVAIKKGVSFFIKISCHALSHNSNEGTRAKGSFSSHSSTLREDRIKFFERASSPSKVWQVAII